MTDEVGPGAISAMWIGGPADGLYEKLTNRKPFRVVIGSNEYLIVTPEQLATGKWIINYYGGVVEQ